MCSSTEHYSDLVFLSIFCQQGFSPPATEEREEKNLFSSPFLSLLLSSGQAGIMGLVRCLEKEEKSLPDF